MYYMYYIMHIILFYKQIKIKIALFWDVIWLNFALCLRNDVITQWYHNFI